DLADHQRLPSRVVAVQLREDLAERLPPAPRSTRAPVVAVHPDPVDVAVARVVAVPLLLRPVRVLRRERTPDPADVGRACGAERADDVPPGRAELGRPAVAGGPFPVELRSPADVERRAEHAARPRALAEQVVVPASRDCLEIAPPLP